MKRAAPDTDVETLPSKRSAEHDNPPSSDGAKNGDPDSTNDASLDAAKNELEKIEKGRFADLKFYEIGGIVVDSHYRPLAGVQVDVWTFMPGTETTTDENGLFRLSVLDEIPAEDEKPDAVDIEVRYTKPGYSPKHNVQQPPGQSVLIVLDDKTYFEGIVKGLDGRPVANAIVKGSQDEKNIFTGEIPGPTTVAKTDDAGRYLLIDRQGIVAARLNPKNVEQSKKTIDGLLLR